MSRRNSQLAKIHIAKQQLGMDDDSYRAMLQRVAGVRSAAALNPSQTAAVLTELQRLGFAPKPGPKNRGKPHNMDAQLMPAMMKKVEALLADMALPWAYADGIAKQMFGIERCCQWPLFLTHFWPIKLTHPCSFNPQLFASVDSFHLPA